MKEQLKAFILQKLGGKLPDDPNQDAIKVCGIKVFNRYLFDEEFRVIDKYDADSLSVGVYCSSYQHVMLSICGNISDSYISDDRFRSFKLSNSCLDDGLERLVKLMRSGVIQLTGYPASLDSRFNEEDRVDHRTVALLATCDKMWLLSINLKHRMLTLPIGKVRPNESLWQGLCREMWEELGFRLEHVYRGSPPNTTTLKTKFKKTYDFDGTPVNIETFVYHIDSDECYSNGIWLQAENREPEKCGGLMWVNRDDIRRIAESTGLILADCVEAALNADMVHIEHVVQR